ncbi:MAG: phosphoglucosamine mutase [Candidatus Bathyarchaeota archaeon]|nr:phosphoglucosamine mutase [Candidatus Bathyarchaeota archaeon]MCX8177786.1 phosphoglucosamine mutase [Candidatus Bathyarchaeota archaeon]MDW8194043.1 phosphoglucosamine mutase [Nitrososphaerota archaeon]
MSINRRLFGTNGIRGVVNKELTPEMAVAVGAAIGTYFKGGKIIIGHDARTSSPMLTEAVISGLIATGCQVLNAGMAPTPALQYAVKSLKTDGGVIITASHNPPEYNGIKVLWHDGIEISREQEIEVENIFFEKKLNYSAWNRLGDAEFLTGILDNYIEAIKGHVNAAKIADKNFYAVVDAANSVAALTVPRLLRELGCRVTTINANIDGTFPGRPPEPRPENLRELSMAVKALHADFGVAFDGDGDRAIFVDDEGEVHWGDKTFALIVKYFLKNNQGEKIVTPVSSSMLVKDVADAFGGEVVWTKVGSVTVSHTMKRINAKLGGEENGGIFYGPHLAVRDGGMATALILDILAEEGRKLSEMLRKLPKYFIEKDKVDCPETLKHEVLKKLIEEVKEQNIITIDGVKIWFEDSSSILIRPSGTEPLYRLYAEAKTWERARELIQKYGIKIRELIDSLKSAATY